VPAGPARDRPVRLPWLTAALADQFADIDPAQDEPMFDRAMTRILTGLLAPAPISPSAARTTDATRH
jgi:hypothetical protein